MASWDTKLEKNVNVVIQELKKNKRTFHVKFHYVETHIRRQVQIHKDIPGVWQSLDDVKQRFEVSHGKEGRT